MQNSPSLCSYSAEFLQNARFSVFTELFLFDVNWNQLKKRDLENISDVSWKINLDLTMIQSRSEKKGYSKQVPTLGSARIGEVNNRNIVI